MKRKPEKKTLEHKIDHLTKIVGRGFKTLEKKMEHGFATVAEDIADIQDIMATKQDLMHMTTKDDLAATEKRLHDEIISKTGSIERRLDQELVDKRGQLEVRVSKLEQKTH